MINEDNRQQILKKWIDLINPKEDGTQAIYAAMNEYAMQECISFMEAYQSGKIPFEKKPDNVKELYKLYLQSKVLIV